MKIVQKNLKSQNENEEELIMPVPNKRKDEKSSDFMGRCMSDPVMQKEYKDSKQRAAICIQQSKGSLLEQADLEMQYTDAEWDEEWGEFTYEVALAGGVFYEDDREKKLEGPSATGEKKVKLNKPFRTPGGPKKFSVYVKNDKGNVVKVNFGDPNMSIKRDDPERRKSYRARHGCNNPGPKWKANYWSCKMWSKTNVSDLT
jgi:hypothetical protein